MRWANISSSNSQVQEREHTPLMNSQKNKNLERRFGGLNKPLKLEHKITKLGNEKHKLCSAIIKRAAEPLTSPIWDVNREGGRFQSQVDSTNLLNYEGTALSWLTFAWLRLLSPLSLL